MTTYLNLYDVADRLGMSPTRLRQALADKFREPGDRRHNIPDDVLDLVPPMRKIGRPYKILASDFEKHIARVESGHR